MDQLVADRLVHEQARAGRAHLALVEEDAAGHTSGRDVEVGRVGHHDLGDFPPSSRETCLRLESAE